MKSLLQKIRRDTDADLPPLAQRDVHDVAIFLEDAVSPGYRIFHNSRTLL
jgi:hypothetical protein